jgi:MerR family transcriptional regulator, redox-sensitive transcriptional activator SoxR
MDHRGLTIGEVARQAGLRPSAIRYDESAGLLPAPERVSGWRRYDGTVRARLAVIELAKLAGFTLADIRTLLRGFSPGTPPSARWHALARQKLPEVEALIARARAMKRLLEEGLNCGCLRLEDCALLVSTRQARVRGGTEARRPRRAAMK